MFDFCFCHSLWYCIMPVDVLQWHADIENFYKCTHPQIKIKYSSHFSFNINYFVSSFPQSSLSDFSCSTGWYWIKLWSWQKKFKPLNCCHWNLNSLTALKMLKACVRYFLSNFYFLSNDRPSKTMKNVFYFI